MRFRTLALVLCLAAGCRGLGSNQALDPPANPASNQSANQPERNKKPTNEDSQPRELVAAKFEEAPTPRTDDELGLAATCIEKGNTAAAADHLSNHLRKHPEQVMIRAYLAELLLKLKRFAEAQHQFDRFIADAQLANGPAKKQLLHCHTRLMEIAQERDDAYGEHLHRGIGMILLARQLDDSIDSEEVEPGFRERLLCKAVAELNRAKKLRPDEPRPHCYLVEAFGKLDQPRSADQARQSAKTLAALLPLPPAEFATLYVAR